MSYKLGRQYQQILFKLYPHDENDDDDDEMIMTIPWQVQ